jgi:hypothetical protein
MTLPEIPALPARPNPAVVALGVVLYAVAGAGTAVFETLLVPLRHGTILIPLAVVLGIISNAALPRLAGMLNDTQWAAAIPALTWTVMVVVLFSSRREGDVLVTTVPWDLKFVAYGMFFGGIIAAVLAVATINRPRSSRRSVIDPLARSGSGIGGVG